MTPPEAVKSLNAAARRLVVRTTAGAVRGREEGPLTVFRGMPFAAPPVGEARFQAPRAPEPWDGVRDAYAFGPPVPQQSAFAGIFDVSDAPTGDEWLTINVWTPAPDPVARRPVMVWIYGGAYKLGYSGSPGYDPRHIARAGDVVVVSFDYRLGFEGFAQLEGAPANRGLLDQIAALEWVRDNIAAFGGDPESVTVFGESAGAGSVAALLAMPSARGLIHRAIAQSVAGGYFSVELARDIATAISAQVGLRPTVGDLSSLDPHRLIEAGAAVAARPADDLLRWGQLAPLAQLSTFAPVIDGQTLPTTPWQALAAGAARDVQLIAGHNAREYRLFLLLSGAFGKITDAHATAILRLLAPGGEAGERAYREAYPDAGPDELFERVHSDMLFRIPSIRLADAQSVGGGRAHAYQLTWPAPGGEGVFGATHGLDVPLLFGTFDADFGKILFAGAGVTPEAQQLSSHLQTAWTTFATTGDPGWPAYDTQRRLVQVLDAESEVTEYPDDAVWRLWDGDELAPLPLLTHHL